MKINERIEKLKTSATVKVMDNAKALKKSGVDVVDLGGGEPDFDSPNQAIEEAINSLRDGETHYVDSRGDLKLRTRISEKLKNENNIDVCPEKGIIITSGGKQALFLAIFTFLNTGDEVLVLDPSWVSYESIIEISGGKAIRVPLNYDNRYQISSEVLESKLTKKTKMIIVNSPNNPTGRMLNDEELLVLEKFILKNNLIAISDEIYEKIIYGTHKHKSLASIKSIAGSVITINGFSKNFAMTGWRIGYLAASSDLVKSMLKLHQHTITCVNAFSQKGAIKALDCIEDINRMQAAYEYRMNYFVSKLDQIKYFECKQPNGAFYVMPRIEYKNMNSYQLADLLLNECNIACTPGEAFGSGGEKCVRMSFATSMDILANAIERLQEYFGAK